MRAAIKIIAGAIAMALLYIWTGAKIVMDAIGRSTLYEDTQHALSLVEKGLNWLFTTPWEVPALLALVLTVCLIWISRPTKATTEAEVKSSPAIAEKHESAALPKQQYVSPFTGKRQLPAPAIPEEIVSIIDGQDTHISAYLSTVHIWCRRHFEAPDPFIDIHVEVANRSVFALTYEGFDGKLFYRDDPIRDAPQVMDHPTVVRHGRHGKIKLRQFVSAELRDRLTEQCGQLQQLAPNPSFGVKFSYMNRLGEKKEARWTVLPDLFDISELKPEAEPDWNLSQAFQYWAKHTERAETFPNDVEQAAFDENISIWGRRDYLNDAVMEKIPPPHWSKSRIEADAAIYSDPKLLDEAFILERSRTVPRNKADVDLTQYWQLKVSSTQIKEHFGR